MGYVLFIVSVYFCYKQLLLLNYKINNRLLIYHFTLPHYSAKVLCSH